MRTRSKFKSKNLIVLELITCTVKVPLQNGITWEKESCYRKQYKFEVQIQLALYLYFELALHFSVFCFCLACGALCVTTDVQARCLVQMS